MRERQAKGGGAGRGGAEGQPRSLSRGRRKNPYLRGQHRGSGRRSGDAILGAGREVSAAAEGVGEGARGREQAERPRASKKVDGRLRVCGSVGGRASPTGEQAKKEAEVRRGLAALSGKGKWAAEQNETRLVSLSSRLVFLSFRSHRETRTGKRGRRSGSHMARETWDGAEGGLRARARGTAEYGDATRRQEQNEEGAAEWGGGRSMSMTDRRQWAVTGDRWRGVAWRGVATKEGGGDVREGRGWVR